MECYEENAAYYKTKPEKIKCFLTILEEIQRFDLRWKIKTKEDEQRNSEKLQGSIMKSRDGDCKHGKLQTNSYKQDSTLHGHPEKQSRDSQPTDRSHSDDSE